MRITELFWNSNSNSQLWWKSIVMSSIKPPCAKSCYHKCQVTYLIMPFFRNSHHRAFWSNVELTLLLRASICRGKWVLTALPTQSKDRKLVSRCFPNCPATTKEAIVLPVEWSPLEATLTCLTLYGGATLPRKSLGTDYFPNK